MVDLKVREGGATAGAPVDNTFPPVNQCFLIEAEKSGTHRPAGPLVKGEALPCPVAGSAQSLVLLGYGVPAAVSPVPHPFQKFLTAYLIPVQTFFRQLLFHYHLGGDAGVVNAGEPEGGVAHHAVPAYHDVFQGGGQGVTDMQFTGDVGRGHYDNEWLLLRVYFRGEIAPVHPELIPLLFYLSRLIGFGQVIFSA
ncbi:hypothetical protein ES703_93897 [subsurface metagenome]